MLARYELPGASQWDCFQGESWNQVAENDVINYDSCLGQELALLAQYIW